MRFVSSLFETFTSMYQRKWKSCVEHLVNVSKVIQAFCQITAFNILNTWHHVNKYLQHWKKSHLIHMYIVSNLTLFKVFSQSIIWPNNANETVLTKLFKTQQMLHWCKLMLFYYSLCERERNYSKGDKSYLRISPSTGNTFQSCFTTTQSHLELHVYNVYMLWVHLKPSGFFILPYPYIHWGSLFDVFHYLNFFRSYCRNPKKKIDISFLYIFISVKTQSTHLSVNNKEYSKTRLVRTRI